MSRASFLGLLVSLLVLTGLITLRGSLLALAVPLILYWTYSLSRGPGEFALGVERHLSVDRAAPNIPVNIKVTVTNQGDGVEQLTLVDRVSSALELLGGSTHHLISLPRGASFTFEYQIRGPRGAYTFDALDASASDHLGLLQQQKEVPSQGQLFVLPVLPRIKEVLIRPRRTRVYAGSIPTRLGGAGVEFFGVRTYLPGDSLRRVNWHASARHPDELYTNESQQERVADVAIVLDGRERSNLYAGRHSLFESSVLAAGSMADALLQQGNRVGLLVYSQYLHWTLPGYGKIQRERILHALASAAPGASQIFEGLQYLPARFFPAESQIILVSPLIEDDYSPLVQLRARGYQVLVVSPDPVAFEAGHLHQPRARYSDAEVELAARIVRLERAWMLTRLRRAGIRVVEWNVAQPFDQVTRRVFSRLPDLRSRL
jgi:uncharacterized protein (DUF58 family)